MNIANALAELGFQETEARFYLAALELGGAPVKEVAGKAGISRTNAYDVFQRLRGQGLVSEVSSGASKSLSVVAAPPTKLLSMFEDRKRQLQGLMPELNSLHVGSLTKPRVRYYEGIEGIKEVIDDTLQCRSRSLLAILSMRDLYAVPGREWIDDFVQRRIEAGIHLRLIRSPVNDLHNQWADDEKDLRQLRYAPDNYLFTMSLFIYDEKVAIISSHRENFAMTIDSAEFTGMQSCLFEGLWSSSIPPNEYSFDTPHEQLACASHQAK